MRPAPYLARAKWVALDRFDTLSVRELTPLIEEAYAHVVAKLPKATQRAIKPAS